MSAPRIGIIMGSQSDWQTMRRAAELCDALDITYEKRIVSAHRTPDRMVEYAKGAAGRTGRRYQSASGEPVPAPCV